mgnify:CR=1 FL=1
MNDTDKLNIEAMSFEEAYEMLNGIVNKMEKSDVSLDESIQYYETGILLKNHCEKKLKNAEVKIKKVISNKIEPI